MGLPAMPGAEGVSLEPLISGRSRDLGLKAYGEAHQLRTPFGLPVLRFVEDGRWVYIHKVGPELYDSTRDPDELVNLASQHPETVERLRSQLAERLRAVPPLPDDARVAIDPERARQLAALGYIVEAGESPASDGRESMELSGDDPLARLEDIRAMAVAQQRLHEGRDVEASLEVMGRLYALGQLDAAGLNNYAWALATAEDPRLRDGEKALEAARRALSLLGAPEPGYLDTLAAAHAAAGEFEQAVSTQLEALRLAEETGADAAILEQLRAHLARFEAKSWP